MRPSILALVLLCAGACLRAEAPAPAAGATALAPASAAAAPSVTATGAPGPASGSAKALSPGAMPGASLRDGFSEKLPIDIEAARLSFDQANEVLVAEGNVALESGGAVVHADKLWYDMKHSLLRAEGQVVVDEDGNTLWARQVAMQQVSRTGELKDLLYVQKPWSAACGGAQLLGGDILVLHGCECTSCQEEQPIWRLSADTLKVKAGDRLWAWGVWLYTGRVPVFYLPYFSQSIKDPRPPVEIKPGYSRDLGFYVRTGYNYYLDEGQYGTVRYDWMDKVGSAYGAGQHYKVVSGTGQVAGYYAVDKNDSSKNGWSGNWSHRQELGPGLALTANLDILSNAQFNETYGISQVDSYQQRSYLSLNSAQKDHSWNLQVGETQVLQSLSDANGNLVDREMVPVDRQVPSFNYSRYSLPLYKDSPLYWNLDANLGRHLVTVPLVLSPTGASAYDARAAYYMDQATVSPALSYTFKVNRHVALNGNANVSGGLQHPDGDQPNTFFGMNPTYGDATYGTWLGVQEKPRAGVTLELGHRYARQLSGAQALPWAGETVNRVEARVNDQWREDLGLLATTSWDLRPYQVDRELNRLDLLRAQLNYTPGSDHSANLTGTWDAVFKEFKTVDASYTANDAKRLWQTSLGFNWVNNSLVSLPTADVAAPPQMQGASPQAVADQLLLSLRGTFNLGPKWKVSYYESLDLSQRRQNEQALDLWRDFGCINVELYLRQGIWAGLQYGFSISLASVPGVSINSNQITNDLFQQVQYGY